MTFPFKILALGGGGTKGVLHIGALKELELRYGNLTKLFEKGIYGSSVGSIVATGLAFGLNMEQLTRITKKYMNMSVVIGKVDLHSVTSVFKNKGLFSMDMFTTQLTTAFQSEGIDIQNKVLGDAHLPLHIVSSNLTKGIPTIFEKNVDVMSAIRASCCIPFLFQPQNIYGNLYVDGGILNVVLLSVIPPAQRNDTLLLALIQSHSRVTPTNINLISPQDYLFRLYKSVVVNEYSKYDCSNILKLSYPSVNGLTDVSDNVKEDMILTGQQSMRSFLLSKSRSQKCIKG
jgi:predicted acylesterase/phospholipase RssA